MHTVTLCPKLLQNEYPYNFPAPAPAPASLPLHLPLCLCPCLSASAPASACSTEHLCLVAHIAGIYVQEGAGAIPSTSAGP